MIQVVMWHKKGQFSGMHVTGHALYAVKGQDIVCSAVSTLAYTSLNALAVVAQIPEEDIQYSISEETGEMKVLLLKSNEQAQTILETFKTGIKLLLEDYSQYISLDCKEV